MRAIWKGALSFGLVNIPVALYTASKEKELSFVLLHGKDNSEIRYARMCKTEQKEVPWEEIVKAYEIEKGDFVIMNDEDFEKANLKKTKTIEIVNFVEEDEIDSVYYVKPYFLEPDKNAEKTYALLRAALEDSKKVGIAKYVLRNREHIAVVKVYKGMIILNELRYQSELVLPKELKIPEGGKFSGKELGFAVQLIDQLTERFNPKEYKDSYVQEMKQIIKKKAKGVPIHPKTAEPAPTKVHDLMHLLQASLEEKKKPKRRTRKSA